LDELPAPGVASQLGIAFTGTLGVLLMPGVRDTFPPSSPVLDELQRHDFHTSPQISDTILKTADEMP
jgi:predicted nucleic acid-binding protein